jgi:site-specific recombinase XerD
MSPLAGKIHTTCGHCGKPMPKAHAVYDGKPYCQSCYCRIFKPIPCQECGKTVRTPNGVGPAMCKKCRTVGRSCIRCGKDVPQAGLVVEGGVACPSCARYFKEPQRCPVCGQLSLHLARDFKNGFTEPVCQQCRRKGHITCPSCGKNRRPAGTTSDGRVICSTCLVTDGKPFVCPLCGKEGRRHSSNRCEACYWRENVEKKLKNAISMIEHEWVRTAFSGFIVALSDRIDAKTASVRLERHFLFFAKLDAFFDKPSAATGRGMISAFGLNGLRRHAAAYGFLVKSETIPGQSTDEIKKEASYEDQAKLLRSCENQWYHGLLGSFVENLNKVGQRYADRGWTGDRQRFGSRTILAALRTAAKFLESIDPDMVRSVQQIEQIHLDRFLLHHKGYRDSLRSFIRYLNKSQKLFKKLKIESVSRNLPQDIFMDRAKYATLVKGWLTPPDDSVKESIIGLLMLLYAQRAKRLVRLRLSDISHGHDGVYRVVFGRTEIPLDQRIGALFDRYLPARKALAVMEESWENGYLFTGRTAGGHLTEAAVSYYLKKHNVTAEQVFATSLLYAYLGGLRHPKVLVKAFGITDFTAIVNRRAKMTHF